MDIRVFSLILIITQNGMSTTFAGHVERPSRRRRARFMSRSRFQCAHVHVLSSANVFSKSFDLLAFESFVYDRSPSQKSFECSSWYWRTRKTTARFSCYMQRTTNIIIVRKHHRWYIKRPSQLSPQNSKVTCWRRPTASAFNALGIIIKSRGRKQLVPGPF